MAQRLARLRRAGDVTVAGGLEEATLLRVVHGGKVWPLVANAVADTHGYGDGSPICSPLPSPAT